VLTTCGECGGSVSTAAHACPHCGCPLGRTPPAARPPLVRRGPSASSNASSSVQVNVHQNPSVVFAVITLIAYLFIYPLGFLLNVVGLFTGPRRGCFTAMLLFFVALPAALLAAIIFTGVHIGVPVIDRMVRDLRESMETGARPSEIESRPVLVRVGRPSASDAVRPAADPAPAACAARGSRRDQPKDDASAAAWDSSARSRFFAALARQSQIRNNGHDSMPT
jgi:hypothetical protein